MGTLSCVFPVTTVPAAAAAAREALPEKSTQALPSRGPASSASPELALCAPRVPDDGGDGDKIPPGAHATAGREEPRKSTVAGELHGLAALLSSANSERKDARAAVPTLLAATKGAIVSPAGCRTKAEKCFHTSQASCVLSWVAVFHLSFFNFTALRCGPSRGGIEEYGHRCARSLGACTRPSGSPN